MRLLEIAIPKVPANTTFSDSGVTKAKVASLTENERGSDDI
jgi:hypothetical protein